MFNLHILRMPGRDVLRPGRTYIRSSLHNQRYQTSDLTREWRIILSASIADVRDTPYYIGASPAAGELVLGDIGMRDYQLIIYGEWASP